MTTLVITLWTIIWLFCGFISIYLWSWDDYGWGGDICFEFRPVSRGSALVITLAGCLALILWLLLGIFWVILKGIPAFFKDGWWSQPFNK